MGGSIALNFALSFPGRVRALINAAMLQFLREVED
jgi:pimeloyl-ACP methyl ester carboxylesterase